jgi:hypothetical protein
MHSRTRSLNEGLGRLERKMSGGPPAAVAAPAAGACTHCQCPGECYGAHPFRALARSSLSGFGGYRDGRWGLTWLGVFAAIGVAWLAVEVAVWYVFRAA